MEVVVNDLVFKPVSWSFTNKQITLLVPARVFEIGKNDGIEIKYSEKHRLFGYDVAIVDYFALEDKFGLDTELEMFETPLLTLMYYAATMITKYVPLKNRKKYKLKSYWSVIEEQIKRESRKNKLSKR